MKSKLFTIVNILLITFFFSSCRKETTGEVTFWQKLGSGYDITVVEIDGVSSNITSEYETTPDCGEAGCAVFKGLSSGKYNYNASDGFYEWSGTVEITKGCLTMELF
jgi:hypothetical protein